MKRLVAIAFGFLFFCGFGCSSGPTGERLKSWFPPTPTAELKLRRLQILEMLTAGSRPTPQPLPGGSNNVTVAVGNSNHEGGSIWDRGKVEGFFNEKADIERELLRRWRRGDKEAYLDIFGQQ